LYHSRDTTSAGNIASEEVEEPVSPSRKLKLTFPPSLLPPSHLSLSSIYESIPLSSSSSSNQLQTHEQVLAALTEELASMERFVLSFSFSIELNLSFLPS